MIKKKKKGMLIIEPIRLPISKKKKKKLFVFWMQWFLDSRDYSTIWLVSLYMLTFPAVKIL